jgi:hypothetical protein
MLVSSFKQLDGCSAIHGGGYFSLLLQIVSIHLHLLYHKENFGVLALWFAFALSFVLIFRLGQFVWYDSLVFKTSGRNPTF